MCACAQSLCAEHLTCLKSAHLVAGARHRWFRIRLRQRTYSGRRITGHLVNYTCSRSKVTFDRFARDRAAANDLPAIGGTDPEPVAIKGNAARSFGLGV